MQREGSPLHGLGVVMLKELSDHLASARMRVLEWLVVLVALAAVYAAITQVRANREYKRPLLRAISEINNCADTQFSTRWVDIFNTVIRKKKVKHK